MRPSTGIAALEDAWESYYRLWALWLRASNQRLPDPELERQERELVEARRDLAGRLRSPGVLEPGSEEELGVRTVRTALPDLDSWVPAFDGVAFDDGGDAPFPEEPEAAGLRRQVLGAWVGLASGIPVGSEHLHRLTLQDRLAREEVPARRRELFDALRTLGPVVDGDGGSDSPYRRLLASSAARWARDGSPIDANAAGLGIDPAAVEGMLRAILRTFREVALSPGLIEPWDYRYAVGGLARRLDPLIP
ncbi:MAG: hypothetical protein L0221_13675, partial [Chloroflexi bacterium]|nr:hypothetical protein [Chloroflexota bacterium]